MSSVIEHDCCHRDVHVPLSSVMAAVDIISALGMAGMTDMAKLVKWISQARIDPNDPSNADLMYLLRVSLPLHYF